ncbi:MAG: hypothetical protein LQ339_001695 [Xanthoria mediterranea]|nr:MAG: hypothetical protein LQ339_001695 [Xanthoria mediterranea]
MSSVSQNTEDVSTGALNSKSPVSNNHKSPKQKTPVEPPIPTIAVFYAFLLVNALAAAFVPIQDCDEVFNYWEPTHYLNRRSGLQTWEYSPEYIIRSWLYIVIHAIVGKFGSLFSSRTTAEFYFIRLALGAVCAACETRLFSTICKTFNTRVGIIFGIVMATSPGMFHASVAYLPSSFSMYMTMLGMAAFMDWRGGLKTGMGMMWFGIGAIVGWPFSGALIIPLLAEDFALSLMTGDISEIVYRYLDGVIRSLLVLALQVAIDAFFYHEVTVVPWNIVSYNVFSGSSRGPDIFGTESWDFYIRNLCLNFNIWFVLALFVGPILGLQFLLHRRSTTKQSPIRSLVFVTPFYLWLAIFSAQGHKEERFMYPAYPFLALGAAIALHTTLTNIGSSDPARLMGKIPTKLKLYVVSLFVLLALDISVARTIGIVTAYRAPLQIYAPLQENRFVHTEANVCLGKDWYRFPSSYFLPNGMRAKFIKSAFDGLLPGQFTEAKTGFGFFPGTWLIPPGMNDQNLEDPGKHVDIDHCSFLVDSYFPNVIPSPLEPNYVEDNDTWEEMRCSAFLDASQTNFVGRILWIPDLEPGKWTVVDFKRPAAIPYPEWDVHETKPLPYRPFRHGPYHITMGLRTMQWDEWIELDNHYLRFHEDKKRRIEERGEKCCKTAPEAYDGAVELLEELCSYLPQRYPSLFQSTPTGIHNLLTQETFDITTRPLAEDPMQMAARLIQDDLAIMFEKPDGQYYLLAGAILLAGFWRLSDKFGMPLSEIHTSGDVPGFKSKLEKGMMNFFRRIQPGQPVLRNNYFIQVDDNLAWSHSIGSEDPVEGAEGVMQAEGWGSAEKNKAIEHHYFRSERQSLRRLPRSGGVVFTIRTYFEPMTKVVEEVGVPGRLASAVRSWGDDVARYKGRERYGEVLLEYLDGKHREQVEKGLLKEPEEDGKYPF